MTLEELNPVCVFGLVAQGHIPTIEGLLLEGKDWTHIANVIGWEACTAREHYERYAQSALKSKVPGFVVDAASIELAKMVELLKKYTQKLGKLECWESNEIHTAILFAEQHLLSTPAKKRKNVITGNNMIGKDDDKT